jgi:hypothetical protein
MTVVGSTRSNGVGDASRHLIRRTDVLPELGSIIFLPFRDPWHARCFIRGLLPAIRPRRPSLAAKPAAGMPIPKPSNRLREKACPRLAGYKTILYRLSKGGILTTSETVHEKSPSGLKSAGSNTMHKYFLALTLLSVPASTGALAHSGTDQDEKACAPDVQRFCRKLMDQGDLTILACLKDNRPKLSRACRYVLVSHGQ